MSSDMISDLWSQHGPLAVVGLLALIGLLAVIGLHSKLGRVNAALKAIDDLLDTIQDQTDSKKEEKLSVLAQRLRKAFPEIADGVDNRGFGLRVYNAHRIYRKALSYSGARKADAEAAVLADAVNGFDGHSIISRIPAGEWKRRVAAFIKTA